MAHGGESFIFFAFTEHSPGAAKVGCQEGYVTVWREARVNTVNGRQAYPSQREGALPSPPDTTKQAAQCQPRPSLSSMAHGGGGVPSSSF